MRLPFDFISAVESRKSVRSYKPDAVDIEASRALQAFSRSLPIPFANVTGIKFFKSPSTKELYYTIRAPEDNMAFVSALDPVSLGKAGFVGELMILRATSLGISTCWVGAFRKSHLLVLSPEALVGVDNPPLKDETHLDKATICCCPIGYYEEKGLRLYDRLAKTVFSGSRKVLADLLEDTSLEAKLPQDIIFALEAGIKAPSAINMQPWRFSFDDQFKSISVGLPRDFKATRWAYPNLDIGICACHLYYALTSLNYQPKVEIFTKNNGVVFRIYLGKKAAIKTFRKRTPQKSRKRIQQGKTVATSSSHKLGYNDLRGALKTVIALYPTVNIAKFGVQIALRTSASLCTKLDPKNKGAIGLLRTAAIVYSKLDTKQRGFNKLLCTARTLLPVFKHNI